MHRVSLFALLALSGCHSDPGPAAHGSPAAPSDPGHSVLQHHHSISRDGVYVEPAFTRAAAAHLHRVPGFASPLPGPVYAQPLFLEGTGAAPDQVIVATEQNHVISFDATSGALRWQAAFGTPVPRSMLPCGNIDPVGITGTPVIDPVSRTLFIDSMNTPDGSSVRHQVFAIDADSGAVKTGWPITVGDVVSGFDALVQNQRGGLLLVGNKVYVPFGGHNGDCGNYYGWVVGVPLADPQHPSAFRTDGPGGGIWSPGGLASDGPSVFAATGNTFGATNWSGGEAILRLSTALAFSHDPADYFAPKDWQQLDSGDVDIGGSGPVLFDLDGNPQHAVISLGKNGRAYLLDRDHLGGVSDAPASAQVSDGEIINAATAYATAQGAYVAFAGSGTGCGGDLAAIRIGAGSPPSLAVVWCAHQNGGGSPIFTTSGDGKDPLVWSVGAGGDSRLHAFDADTGAEVFNGGADTDALGPVQHFQTPIVANGRLYVAGNDALYAFEP